jgi:2-desacetyl-2-hydroxyethyl bacteriochlorophyllide A dehydrogenase
MEKTEAVVFTEANKFEMRELTLKDMGPHDISVRTLVTAVSPGTERWILKGKHAGTRFPCVPGYHRIGIVEKCGGRVKDLHPGDIVYGGGGGWQEDLFSMWGAHCSYSVEDAAGCRFISSFLPDKAELETTVFTMASAVGYKGIRFLEIKGGEKILIIGAGFIGLCAAQLAVLKNAFPVFMETNSDRIAFAKELGFRAWNPGDKGFDRAMKEFAPEGTDAIYDTAGVAPAVDIAVKYAGRWSRLLLQAQYFDRNNAIDIDGIKMKEMTIKTTCGVDSGDWDSAFTEIRKRRLRIDSLITHRFLSAECLRGYEMLLEGKPFNLGIVFFWDKDLIERHSQTTGR